VTLVLFWDIDGTLLTTGRAGIFAWEDATQEIVGRSVVDFSPLKTAGLTDVEIARKILMLHDLDPTRGLEVRLLRRYEELLPLRLPWRKGQVLRGVREVLEFLRHRPDVVSLLLTGNTRTEASAKLRHYGLAEYFDGGAFADAATDRPSIARAALALARERVGERVRLEQTYVIGDTPHDVHCAREIGARSIAVASGPYTVEDLNRHNPWWVIECLPDPPTFLSKLSRHRRRRGVRAGEPKGAWSSLNPGPGA
jgi:phosphoglycolate phosphatase-like HAD superfamily hydrolase